MGATGGNGDCHWDLYQIIPSIQPLKVRKKIVSAFMHPGFRPSSPAQGLSKSSKELAVPPVLPPPERTKLTQIRAPECGNYFCARPKKNDIVEPSIADIT
jgi:hypothetical protein